MLEVSGSSPNFYQGGREEGRQAANSQNQKTPGTSKKEGRVGEAACRAL